MIIKELTVNKNSLLYEDAVYIFSKTNLIHSEKNAKGKTSLVRLLLYSLGYNIPATKGLKSFNNITTEAIVENNNETYIIKRYFRYITVEEKRRPTTEYILPEQEKELHKKIINIDNKQIIDNLLGSYYIDQDKGWTLLNRGKVIGDIRFNIENLISGITNSDITEDKEKIKKLTSGSRAITVRYSKVKGAGGYQIAIRKKGTTKWKKYKVKGYKKVSKTIKKLKKGKTYQVKVRAYRTVSTKKSKGKTVKNTYYGNWSAIRKIKVK